MSTKQEEIDEKFQRMTSELNRIIVHTDEYNYGGFRFRVYESADGTFNFIAADADWFDKYEKRIRKVLYRYGYQGKFDKVKGICYLSIIKEEDNYGTTKETILRGKN